jgi:hypothetical protein
MRGLNLQITRMAGLIAFLACLIFVPGCSEDPESPSDPGPTPIPTRGLRAFYPFNGDALDASGNDNNATLRGGASVTTFLTIGDNNVDNVLLPYGIFDGMGDFTVSVWGRINTLHNPGNNFILSGARGSVDNVFYLEYTTANGEWKIYIRPSTAVFASVSITDSEWHHVVFLRSNAVARFYIDNKEIGDGMPIDDVAINIGENGLIVGQDQDSEGSGFQTHQSWAGDLDNLRIYNRTLTRSEIRALYEETGWGD